MKRRMTDMTAQERIEYLKETPIGEHRKKCLCPKCAEHKDKKLENFNNFIAKFCETNR